MNLIKRLSFDYTYSHLKEDIEINKSAINKVMLKTFDNFEFECEIEINF